MIYLKLENITPVATSHPAVLKKVLSNGYVDLTRITQIAWARLLPNEQVPQHRHPDMDECFFFTKGSGEIIVDEVKYELAEGVFLIIPAGASHSLYCTGETLEFFYFGLQVYG